MRKLLLLATFFICCFKFSYSQPGALDLLFGNKGTVRADFGTPKTYASEGKQVLLQSDGSMYILFESSAQTYIKKIKPDGSADSTFGSIDFSIRVPINGAHTALQKDGKIVVAGTLNDEFALTRYNSNGSLDVAFGDGGKVATDFTDGHDAINSIAIQPDGKIIVAGTAFLSNYDDYTVIYNIAIARYNINGSLDNSFNGNGKLITQLQTTNINNYIAIQPDAKIVVANGDNGVKMARFNSNGSPDNTLITHPVTNADGNYFTAKSLAIQSDGKIVLGGSWYLNNSNPDFVVVRFNSNGSFDNTFNKNGIQTTDFRTSVDYINSIVIQSNGKIVAGGTASNGNNFAFSIARYNTNGSLDSTFDGDGKKMTYITSNDIIAESVALGSDGKIVEVGYEQASLSRNIALIRYNSDGSFDNTLNGSGRMILRFKIKTTVFTSSAIQKDGKIVTAGYAWNGKNFDFAVARYNPNGSLDNTFSSDGVLTTDIGSSDNRAKAVAIQFDGKIVVAGYASNGLNNDFAVVRYNIDGSLDKTFSSDGIQTTDFGYREEVSALAIQSDGKIVVTGTLYQQYQSDDDEIGLVRYNTDGSLDKSFSEDGKQKLALPYDPVTPSGIAIQRDGKIVVAGTVSYNVIIARYKTDGSLDSSFGHNGLTEFAIQSDQDGSFTYGYSVAIQKDGKIIVGAENGYFDRVGKHSDILIARFNADGSLDNSFSQNGYVELLYSTENASIALQDDGKIAVVSNRHDYVDYGNGDYQEIQLGYVLARLNSNGVLDSTFGKGGTEYIPNSEKIAIQSTTIANNKLYAVGYGTDVNNYGFLARFLLAPNKAPTVSITSPSNNKIFTAPATFTINVTASDSDGTVSSVKFYNGSTYLKTDFTSPYSYTISNLPAGTYTITAKATDNAGAQTVSAPVKVVVNARPTVNITSPANNAVYSTPANITVNASASDADGNIYSVKFYNGSTYLKTDFTSPYSYTISNLPAGTYKLTAKATDNNGAETISAPVTVKVNNAPIVSITGPANNATYTAPANITVNASASDADGNIYSVKFYKGSTYLKTVFTSPYTYTLSNLSAGIYTLTAKATDNNGAETISAPVTVKVLSAGTVVSKPFNDKADEALSLKLSPNPATNVLNIYALGLQQNKPVSLTVISASGVVMKTMQTNSSAKTVQLDVSSLISGVYTIKLISGDKVMYKQFVKL